MHQLATIKAVKSQRPDQERTIFGMLSEIREGELFLEDPEDSIKIDIGHLSGGTPNGATQLFTEGSFVILTGHVAEGTSAFTVTAASPPPIEPRCETLALASHPDHAEGSSFAESIVWPPSQHGPHGHPHLALQTAPSESFPPNLAPS